MAKLEYLYAFILEDTGPDDEGIITLKSENTQGEVLWLPVGTPYERDLQKLSELAQGIGSLLGKKVTLVKFSDRTDISVFSPSVKRV